MTSRFTAYAGMEVRDFEDLDLAEEWADKFSHVSIWENDTDTCVYTSFS